MSVPFGFSLGDFIAVGQLAWTLYRQCYLVARGAPQEFQHLLGEITMLCQSIQFLQEEVNNPNSTLVRAGDDRVALVNQVMSRVEETLKELQKCANKYEKLGDVKQPKVKQMWRRVKWSVDAADLDALRNKLVYHNGIINLLLTSAGNSSLERIENATHKIERRLSDIKTFIRKAESHGVETQTPRITNSMTGDELFDLKLSTTLMKNAEVSGRWASIGIDQWIQAGRWWLLRAQMDIHTPNSPNHMMPQRGYANLIKASWILIDIISRHPQLNFLYSDVQLEVELLAGMIREEFRIIERLGLQIPNLKNLSENDMQIWELEVKGDTLQPGDAPDNTGASRPWVIADEHIIFQQFGHCQSLHATRAPCLVLVLAHKRDSQARIALYDQAWRRLAKLEVSEEFTLSVEETSVHIDGLTVEFSATQDANHFHTVFIAVSEFLFRYKRNEHMIEVIQAFTLLCAVRYKYSDVVTSLLPDEQNLTPATRSFTNLPIHIEARKLASQFLNGTFREDKFPRNDNRMNSLFLWAARNGLNKAATLLLEQKGLVVDESDIEHWASPGAAARHGLTEAIDILFCEGKIHANSTDDGWSILQLAAKVGHSAMIERLLLAGADVNARPWNEYGRTALQAAAEGGHQAVVERLLQAGADVNAEPSNEYGRTALQAAAEGGHQAVVERLLQAGGDVNAEPSYRGRTALQAAAEGGHQAVVERLLQAGADVNAKPSNYDGRTALQAAAEGGHQAVVERLLEAGADVNAKPLNSYGRRALHAAAQGGHQCRVFV